MTTHDDNPERPSDSSASPMSYATDYHAPVLWKKVVEMLVTDPAGIYIDATLGGGGHAQALLDALAPGGRVLGIDRDPEALSEARERLHDAREAGRFTAAQGTFGQLQALLESDGAAPVDGVLLDLGLSSHQIDDAERGFSFQAEGPLDMRMNPEHGLTAAEIVNDWREGELRRIFFEFGEERHSSRIARAIIEARPLHTTEELADVVRRVVPTRDEVKTLARIFQAIRIAVNAELDELEGALKQATEVVRTGGRMAVISYHSLEDRRVKRYFRYGNFEGEPVRDLYGTLIAPWSEINRSPIRATDGEIEANPRARSARLRVAERQEPDAGPPHPNIH